MENTFPLIETGVVPEFTVDGAYRIDEVGSLVHVHYFQFVRDPHINNGMIYRVPVVKHIRPRDTLAATAGVIKEWITNRAQPPLIVPPSFIRQRLLM